MSTENQIVSSNQNGGYTLSTKGGDVPINETDIRRPYANGAMGFIPMSQFRTLTGTKGAESARLYRTLVNQIGGDQRAKEAACADKLNMITTKSKWDYTSDGRRKASIQIEEPKPITPPKQGNGSKLKAENQALKQQVEAMAKMLGVDPEQLPQQ